jgi:hypothetical protein
VETLTVLRLLVRLRLLVALGALLAVAAGAVATGRLGIGPFDGSTRLVWVATSEVQVDTPRPLAIDAHASAATIQTQTILLADYVTSDDSRDGIAREVGLRRADLTVTTPSVDSPLRQSPLVSRTLQQAAVSRTAYTVTANPAQLTPIMALVASGPDRETTVALAGATAKALRSAAGPDPGGSGRGLRIEELGPVGLDSFETGGSGLLLGAALAVFLFCLWCGAIVVVSGVVRAWRSSPAYQCTPAGLR